MQTKKDTYTPKRSIRFSDKTWDELGAASVHHQKAHGGRRSIGAYLEWLHKQHQNRKK